MSAPPKLFLLCFFRQHGARQVPHNKHKGLSDGGITALRQPHTSGSWGYSVQKVFSPYRPGTASPCAGAHCPPNVIRFFLFFRLLWFQIPNNPLRVPRKRSRAHWTRLLSSCPAAVSTRLRFCADSISDRCDPESVFHFPIIEYHDFREMSRRNCSQR